MDRQRTPPGRSQPSEFMKESKEEEETNTNKKKGRKERTEEKDLGESSN